MGAFPGLGYASAIFSVYMMFDTLIHCKKLFALLSHERCMILLCACAGNERPQPPQVPEFEKEDIGEMPVAVRYVRRIHNTSSCLIACVECLSRMRAGIIRPYPPLNRLSHTFTALVAKSCM